MAKAKRGGTTNETAWRNRITRYGEEAPDQLLAHENNWRIHPGSQQEALRDVLSQVGLVQNVIISERSGKCLDGHLRIQMAISEGQPTVPVTYVDLTDAEEKVVVASFDPISSAAATDGEKLNDLLQDINLEHGALDDLLASLFNEGQQTQLQDMVEAEGGGSGDASRPPGDRSAQIKPVLYAEQIAVFEEALRLTGEINRGAALIQICQFYLDNERTEETGQLNSLVEAFAAG